MRHHTPCRIALVTALILFAGAASAGPYLPLKYKWDYSVSTDLFYFLDLEQTGEMEVYAIIMGQENYINAFNSTGQLQWSTSINEMKRDSGCTPVGEDVYYIYVDDINNNKDLDVFVASKVRGEKVNLNPVAYFERETDEAAQNHKQIQRWKFDNFEGMVNDMSSADLNFDGKKELIAASALGFVYILGDTGTTQSKTVTYLENGVWKQRTTYILQVQVINKYELDGNAVNSVAVSDIDRDGKPEIIAGTYRGIYLIDGGVKWRYPTETGITKVAASNLDEKGLIVATDGSTLYALDAAGKLRWQKKTGTIAGLLVSDLDNDTELEAITSEGDKIRAYGTAGDYKWEYPHGEIIHKMSLLSNNELAISTKNRIYLLEMDGSYAKNLTGYKYLDKAYEYYTNEDCLSARSPAQKAMDIFTEINNTVGMLDCEVIQIYCANETANKELADEYYALAQKYFQDKNYGDARAYADKALEIYSDVGYTYGVTWLCGTLLQEIDTAEFKVKVEAADKLYSQALWYYTTGELHNSTLSLEKAKRTYQEINYTKGLENCEDLYKDIEIKQKKETANELSDLGKRKYAELDYSNAIISLDQALEIYREINATNETIELSTLKNISQRHIDAEECYAQAESNYNIGQYENATYYANQSKNMYMELEEYQRAAVSDQMISDSQGKIKEKQMREMAQTGGMILGAIIIVLGALYAISRFRRQKP
ncbi:MAG: PQQ-binding-like beta-propeller repeat protein [Candidatus Altiarchaeia archaeon]